jgi:hypothetical protein
VVKKLVQFSKFLSLYEPQVFNFLPAFFRGRQNISIAQVGSQPAFIAFAKLTFSSADLNQHKTAKTGGIKFNARSWKHVGSV